MRPLTHVRFQPFVLLLVPGLLAGGCSTPYYGTYPNGLAGLPTRKISAEQAVEAAEPYLDQSFALSRAERGSNRSDSKPRIRVKLEGNQYSVSKDDHISMNAGYGFEHAVKVNAETGEVTPPK